MNYVSRGKTTLLITMTLFALTTFIPTIFLNGFETKFNLICIIQIFLLSYLKNLFLPDWRIRYGRKERKYTMYLLFKPAKIIFCSQKLHDSTIYVLIAQKMIFRIVLYMGYGYDLFQAVCLSRLIMLCMA